MKNGNFHIRYGISIAITSLARFHCKVQRPGCPWGNQTQLLWRLQHWKKDRGGVEALSQAPGRPRDWSLWPMNSTSWSWSQVQETFCTSFLCAMTMIIVMKRPKNISRRQKKMGWLKLDDEDDLQPHWHKSQRQRKANISRGNNHLDLVCRYSFKCMIYTPYKIKRVTGLFYCIPSTL